MWSQYASPQSGVALKCRYEKLRAAMDYYLKNVIASDLAYTWIGSGKVHYNTESMIIQPFFKSPEYKDEREVRFVVQLDEHENYAVALPLNLVVDDLEVITPPDAPKHHRLAMDASWEKLKTELKS